MLYSCLNVLLQNNTRIELVCITQMKKLLSISFAAIIVLSGLHLSVAAHFCGGEISAWKVSVDKEKASCGMCADEASSGTSLSTESCCKDALSVLNVDNDYQLAQLKVPSADYQLLQVFVVPQHIALQQSLAAIPLHASIRPPGNYLPEAVALADICVFRI